MKKISLIILSIYVLAWNVNLYAETPDDSKSKDITTKIKPDKDGDKIDDDLAQFGFGPAFYLLQYDKEVLKDTKDVRVRGDGTIDTSGTDYATAIGLEVHYDFSMAVFKNKFTQNYSGHKISPFLGLFDLDNGINGMVVGVLYGYWHTDKDNKNKTSLNVGLGKFIHKDQLVLSSGVNEGFAPAALLEPVDYTSREDVEGATLMISASVGF